MIISHKHKFIFIHIPKNAGTAICGFLHNFLDKDDYTTDYNQSKDLNIKYLNLNNLIQLYIEKNTIPCYLTKYNFLNNKLISPSHICINLLKLILNIDYDNYFIFCIVRDPIERLCSMYNYYKSNRNNEILKHNTIDSTIITYLYEKRAINSNIPIYESHNHLYRNQISWIMDENNNIQVNYIIYYSNLQEGLKYISNKLSINFLDLPIKNKGILSKNPIMQNLVPNIVLDY